jgi:DNA-dependent RNA polymerase auxiliary subunit epsilon
MPEFNLSYTICEPRYVTLRYTQTVEAESEDEAKAAIRKNPWDGEYLEHVSDDDIRPEDTDLSTAIEFEDESSI